MGIIERCASVALMSYTADRCRDSRLNQSIRHTRKDIYWKYLKPWCRCCVTHSPVECWAVSRVFLARSHIKSVELASDNKRQTYKSIKTHWAAEQEAAGFPTYFLSFNLYDIQYQCLNHNLKWFLNNGSNDYFDKMCWLKHPYRFRVKNRTKGSMHGEVNASGTHWQH